MKKLAIRSPLIVAALVVLLAALKEHAAPTFSANAQDGGTGMVEASATSSGLVTLNAEDALITQILNAFSRQTGRSIVIGPEITGRTTVRLTNVSWDDALDAVLKPFGYTHYQAGNATVVSGMDPIQTRLIELKHLDASDVEEVLKTFLSPRGKMSRLILRGQSWAGGVAERSSSVVGGETMGKRQRERERADLTRSKTLVVTDTPDVFSQIESFLEKIDRAPHQVLIEARFLEVNPQVLRDIGIEFATVGGYTTGGNAYQYGVRQESSQVAPGNFTPFSTPTLEATAPFNAGMSMLFQKLTDFQYSVLLHALQEDADANVLSAPRILTVNNQEAVIIVGQKFPIINSDASEGSGGSATITTSLRGYEDIGIQLNVLPQICEDNLVHMIVRPSVRELIGTRSGKTVSGETTALTDYPVISTREAETQVIVENGQTIVIGGLLKDRESKTTIKVPFLGDLPLLGWLFRRETVKNEKIDLLIFLTASIVPPEGNSLTLTNIPSPARGPLPSPEAERAAEPAAVPVVEVAVAPASEAAPVVAVEEVAAPSIEAVPVVGVESAPAAVEPAPEPAPEAQTVEPEPAPATESPVASEPSSGVEPKPIETSRFDPAATTDFPER